MKLMIDIDDKVYEYIKSIPLHTMLEEAVIEGTPLDKVIENIKAEIDEQIKYNTYFNSDMAKGEIIAFEWIKRKIDEYGKEQE